MKRMKAFDFEIVRLSGPPRLTCKFITKNNDSITFVGNTVQEIYEQCKTRFPEGIQPKGIIFSGSNPIDAKINFCAFLTLGLGEGYFNEKDFNKPEEPNEELEE
jgi:hypothetical protein